MLKPKHTVSKHVKKQGPTQERKSTLDKRFKMKLSNIYSEKLSKFNLEKKLNTIRKMKYGNYTNNIVKKLLNKNTNSQSDFNLSYKYENTTTQKLTILQKKTEEENKNVIKHIWAKGTCVVIEDSMVAGIHERKMSSKRLIKVRSFPGASCSDMYHYLVPILERNPDHLILHVRTNDVAHYERTEIVDKLLELKSFIVEKLPTTQLPTTLIIISHPVTKTNSKHLAMKLGDIQSHLCKLQIDIIESGNISSNHLNCRRLHLKGKGILQFAKNLVEVMRKL